MSPAFFYPRNNPNVPGNLRLSIPSSPEGTTGYFTKQTFSPSTLLNAAMEAPNSELMSALATLLEAGKYSDLTIVCGQKRFAVHRAIICSRSGFFDGACSNPFREAETGIIDLSEDDEEAVEHMVNYFYHLDYLSRPKSHQSSRRSSRAASIASSAPITPLSRRRSTKLNLAFVEDPLLATAAAYSSSSQQTRQPPIQEESEGPATPLSTLDGFGGPVSPMSGKFAPDSAIDMSLEENPFDSSLNLRDVPEQELDPEKPHLVLHSKMYALAEKYNIVGLKALARKKFASQMAHHWSCAEFPEAIQDVYETTIDQDRGLRNIVIQTFREHPELALRKDVEEFVKDTPSLAWELFRVGWGLPISG